MGLAAAEPISEGGPDDDRFMAGGWLRFCDGGCAILILLRLGSGAGDPPDFSIFFFLFVFNLIQIYINNLPKSIQNLSDNASRVAYIIRKGEFLQLNRSARFGSLSYC